MHEVIELADGLLRVKHQLVVVALPLLQRRLLQEDRCKIHLSIYCGGGLVRYRLIKVEAVSRPFL